jgi:tetratricopeptide (TPR) repeat protein
VISKAHWLSHSVLKEGEHHADTARRLSTITIEILQLSKFLSSHVFNPEDSVNLQSCMRSGELLSEKLKHELTEDGAIERKSNELNVALSAELLSKQVIKPDSRYAIETGQTRIEMAQSEYVDVESHLKVVQRSIELATLQFNRGEYSEAQILLESTLTRSKQIRGTRFERGHEIMEMLAMCYCQQSSWEAVTNILLQMLEEQPEYAQRSLQTLEVMHSLAEVYLAKQDFRNAENWCQKAMAGRRITLGDQHALYHKSVLLLVEIFEVQGKMIEADGYKSVVQGSSIYDSACEGNMEEVQQLLHKVSADDRDTALIVAAYNGHDEIVKLLLENNANVDVMEVDGEPVLIIAARKGHEGVVRILLESGANVEARDGLGETALMLAAMNGYEHIVRLLVDNSVNVDAKNRNGLTALKLAERKGKQCIVSLLRKQRSRWFQNQSHVQFL